MIEKHGFALARMEPRLTKEKIEFTPRWTSIDRLLHPPCLMRARRVLPADTADPALPGPWFSATVPGMYCLPQRTNATSTSPRALPFGVSA
jgi:hypothetical protein